MEEQAAKEDPDAHAKEIELLQKESELPLEDLLSSLPPGMLDDKPGSSTEGVGEKKGDDKAGGSKQGEQKEEPSLKAMVRCLINFPPQLQICFSCLL